MTGIQFSAGTLAGFFLFAAASRLVLGPTKLPVQWVPGTLTRPERETDHSPPSSAEIKIEWGYTCTGTTLRLPYTLNVITYHKAFAKCSSVNYC